MQNECNRIPGHIFYNKEHNRQNRIEVSIITHAEALKPLLSALYMSSDILRLLQVFPYIASDVL